MHLFLMNRDPDFAAFLNGLIIEKRGKKEGAQPPAEQQLNNNIIFMKLSKHELSAFFRRPGHKHYRECKDQGLRSFLQGLQARYRNKPESD
jgi:uncharacterized protein YehS (DUF1456 family)